MSIPIIYCESCGQAMRRGSAFCPACRHPVGEAPSATAPGAAPQPSRPRPQPGTPRVAGTGGSIDVGQAFSFVFDDPAWIRKVLIGGLLSLTIILLPAMYGYLVDTARNVRDGIQYPMPSWGENFGGRWMRGFSILVISIIWTVIISMPLLL